jgi:hypothetical protein
MRPDFHNGAEVARAAEEHAAQLTPEQRAARAAKSRESNAGNGVPIFSDAPPMPNPHGFFFDNRKHLIWSN